MKWKIDYLYLVTVYTHIHAHAAGVAEGTRWVAALNHHRENKNRLIGSYVAHVVGVLSAEKCSKGTAFRQGTACQRVILRKDVSVSYGVLELILSLLL